MPQIVNTNIASLNAQRNLNRSQSSLQVALSRISSGLRVNSARDDAAGLAISDRMTAQIRGFDQAGRNAADAISLAQTGEGALAELTNNLQRMRELSIQSRNATNTDTDRQSLDQEFQQLLAENDRIASTTAFNGRKVLDGSLGSSVFQVGANVGETISVDVSSSMRNNAIGSVATKTLNFASASPTSTGANFAALVPDNVSLAADQIQVNNVSIGAATDAANGLGDGSAAQIAEAINAQQGVTDVTATANASTLTITNANFSSALQFNDLNSNDTLAYTLQINGTTITTQNEGAVTISNQNDLITSINGASKTTGVVATLQSNGDIKLTAQDGRNIEFAEQISNATDADTVTTFLGSTLTANGANAASSTTAKGTIALTANRDIVVTDVAGGDNYFAEVGDGTTQTFGAATIGQSNILSATNADDAIRRIDQALSDVDVLRGTFGAIQSRFESTIRSLQTSGENASAARSRIMDADFAAETAALTRGQILQQAGVSILAQANALPQQALALLR